MPVFKAQKCSECKFYKLNVVVNGYAHSICRRYPKQVYYTQLGHSIDFAYPKVDQDDWCGEFVRKGIK